MSSFTRQLAQSVPVAHFALGKYSQAITSIDHNGPVNWNHLHGNGDLSVVFEKHSLSASATSSGHETLYLKVIHGQRNLEELDLNYLAREATQQALSRQARSVKPVVAVIVKLPCIAIRYPGRVGQLKFSSDRDYYTALAILSEINCPFTEPAASHTSRSTSLRPASSSSQMMMSVSSSFAPPEDWGYQSPAMSGLNPRGNGLSRSQSTVGSSSETRSSISASSTRSSLSSHTACHPNENMAPPMNNTAENGSRPVTQHLGSTRSEVGLRGHGTSQSNERPTTAPAFHDPQALNQALPPKRELPFSRPGNSYTSSKLSSTKPSSTNGTGSGLQADMLDGLSSTSGSLSRRSGHEKLIGQNDAAASSLGQPFTLKEAEKRWSVNQDQVLNQPSATSRSTSSPTGRLIRSATTASHQPGFHFQSPQAQTGASPISNVPSDLESRQQSTTVASNDTISIPLPSQAPINSADLSSYLEIPESERSALVDSWICEQLEDDGFVTLCQDVERVWRRIAFGS
ncbi:hypothetical protein T310_0180 [Rasamsonia emersonii CBS 393.64]|uniref:Uncharacterized protein n=1 Tax=Rasamsonia emersonii (strain ATCC 16479 / CBS 393.64 / IMI 116815) TaxID=1408163 RepID=A0A0F4Z5I2_RASE3|nr:hypothetical protein T310_0180 [Rasamsonia emersonii CBS 393.64]KKA25794.1 hypothetical protein T310_0180 [Rasamsonia emersonii CBS 393.64]